MAPVLEVTQKLDHLSYMVTTLKNASPFSAPSGESGAAGGRGVYLKNEPATGRNGTTWTFTLGRKAPDGGAVIVHPLGNGHIVIHLREQGLFVLSPKDFVTSLRQGGDGTKVKLTEAGKTLFPLGGKQYRVVSQLTGSGKYTITVNDQVAGTAAFLTGEAIAFSKGMKGEKGATLPTGRLNGGSAALIAGGAEKGGGCEIKTVTFQAAAPEPAP